ncbi:hypothetical protein LA080_015164 [Diaporthe eres]|nr:hypothetical protein LA080_015164 [Diaporthe eres]
MTACSLEMSRTISESSLAPLPFLFLFLATPSAQYIPVINTVRTHNTSAADAVLLESGPNTPKPHPSRMRRIASIVAIQLPDGQPNYKDTNLPAAILGGRAEPLSSFPLSRPPPMDTFAGRWSPTHAPSMLSHRSRPPQDQGDICPKSFQSTRAARYGDRSLRCPQDGESATPAYMDRGDFDELPGT